MTIITFTQTPSTPVCRAKKCVNKAATQKGGPKFGHSLQREDVDIRSGREEWRVLLLFNA